MFGSLQESNGDRQVREKLSTLGTQSAGVAAAVAAAVQSEELGRCEEGFFRKGHLSGGEGSSVRLLILRAEEKTL